MTNQRYGRTTRNPGFEAIMVEAVWRKAYVIPGFDPSVRRDVYGALIDRDQYGVTIQGGMGWEIDHIIPVAYGGSNDLSNLQPLQWQNNRAKSDHLSNQRICHTTSRQRLCGLLNALKPSRTGSNR